MKYYLKVLQQYADFNGRARRKEYWNFILYNAITGIILAMLGIVLEVALFLIRMVLRFLSQLGRLLHEEYKIWEKTEGIIITPTISNLNTNKKIYITKIL